MDRTQNHRLSGAQRLVLGVDKAEMNFAFVVDAVGDNVVRDGSWANGRAGDYRRDES
jgi:hypothetical protein